ncbi:hypothetical protein BV898_05795 [Hypsibius exemplaris]|uniref:Uncharacterized protein n=1 Tax=Hypsibius exemplaris TaxID=2072580 RepID=A0A1W0WYG5_HYPEX|nr:hypothetical protein BV898_05795 [Hypsibius exemplaris]
MFPQHFFISDRSFIGPSNLQKLFVGPDDPPRYPKVLVAGAYLFRTYDLDVLFIVTNAFGQSAFNEVERRMAPLSGDISGMIFPHDVLGSRLNASGKTVDAELEKQNFAKAGDALAGVWSGTMIDGYPVLARYIPSEEPKSVYNDMNEEFMAKHVRTSFYFIQIVRCNDLPCCRGRWRSSFPKVFSDRFLLIPIRYVSGRLTDTQYSLD